ncbi:lysine exporter LysO family protein [Anaerolentibacter hominis]|uniref:lysine exporter LysO family protein n=1 Tax=Anaerolentibacter hominis TaxID=3079009 RepID=UPI0031B80A39
MVLIAVAALAAGMIYGLSGAQIGPISYLTEHSDYILYVLMFSVGISIGLNKAVFQNIKKYHIKICIIPFGIVAGTLIGGLLCSLLMGQPPGESLVIVSGLGWYSLSGILVTQVVSAQAGTVAFLSSLMREILSFLSIPWVSRRFNYYTAIAPAAATSEDTTLPMLIRHTNEEVVVMAVFNGVICSALVPVLIRFFGDLFF